MDSILVVEDKHELRAMLRAALTSEGYRVEEAADGHAALTALRHTQYDAVLTDLKLPGNNGIEILHAAREVSPATPVLLMTAYGSIEEAVQAMKDGAYDFIQKPLDLEQLALRLRRAIGEQKLQRQNVLLRQELAERYGLPKIIGDHDSMKQAAAALQRIATTATTVLLLGESGTGKELFARAVHQLSARAAEPFVAINCAAIPETLVETELFGHEKGAFTGANARKLGKFELAHRGTIFLDEIGEIPLAVQAKILRVLEEREFERVGGVQTVQVDVRIVAATNRDLEEAAHQKQFREDLYFRLSAFPIRIPPLRERGNDIIALAEAFLAQYSREFKKSRLRLSTAVRKLLLAYRWPGNVRELQNAIERAVILAEGTELRAADLQLRDVRKAPQQAAADLHLPDDFDWQGPLPEVLKRAGLILERRLLREALEQTGWNKQAAAQRLGITYKRLLTRMQATEV
ncbi:MAG: sigma-54-dependent Fis family transcriptional regulator [Acidobacteria bacterium]|nr:MAG: sigma-54-dependent Fis family transcriptional regulator [Acidobacteriota bacterium]